jgi:CRISPR type IV-associated protein Csf3
MQNIKRTSPVFQNLRIRAYLETPIMSEDKFLPLDAIVYDKAVSLNFDTQSKDVTYPNASTYKRSTGLELPFKKANRGNLDGMTKHLANLKASLVDAKTPLERYNINQNILKTEKSIEHLNKIPTDQRDAWYYKCSFAQFPHIKTDYTDFYNKRFSTEHADLIDLKGLRGKIETQKGKFKNYHKTSYNVSTPYVDWFAVADKKELENILRFCTHIGKKTSQGFGSVSRWEVIEWNFDWSERGPAPSKKGSKPKLMRAVPSISSNIIYGIRPSYWNPRHQYKVILPEFEVLYY